MLALLQPVMAALLGGAGGIVGRLLPELFDYLQAKHRLEQAKADQAHERALMDKQIELQKLTGAQRLEEISGLEDVEAVKGAVAVTRPTGIFLVDILNGLVRPVVTYWYFGLYAAYKTVLIVGLLTSCKGTGAACDIAPLLAPQSGGVWAHQDMAALSGILNFWFLDRVIRHKARSH